MITLEDAKNDYKFLNKENIQKFSKSENKLTVEHKKQLTSDVEKLFQVKLLKQKLNELKKVNEYKIILDEVDSVFEHIELIFNDNFEINSEELSAGVYIGNVIVDYNIVTHYKGVNDVEKFKQSGILKYTSTESKAFKYFGDVMYKNIVKDMFTSSEEQKYVNLKWNDIKEEKQDYEAFVSSNSQLKKYYNENKDFQKGLLKIINDKYFKPKFPSLQIGYSKPSIYKTDNFLEKNKDYLFINNLDDQNAIKLKEIDSRETISKILLGNEKEIKRILRDDVFNLETLEKNKKKYRVAQDKFLKGFLSETEVSEYQKTKYYDLAVAMGYVEFVGPVIKIGNNDFSYDHQFPDFKLAVSYSMNGLNDNLTDKSFIDLSLKLFGVYKNIWNPAEFLDLQNKFKINYLNSKDSKIWNRLDKTGSGKNNKWNINIMNGYLNQYSSYYFKELDKSLNLLDMTRNIFKSSNILYSFDVKNSNLNGLLRLCIYNRMKNGENSFWKNLNYMRFDLFGIVKINIYLEEIKNGEVKIERIF
ncbi:hypothetical protein [Spiroplasma endosymbiont of Atherix ibis]|uniref:hypothetical protein n=1 Tax=Spiroplasma endosymbiont of Atherix ibis TaxID=3066291 RepID=UPI0030CDA2BB